MQKLQILLALSGSRAAQSAADFSWSLAKKGYADVAARHVIDTSGAIKLLGCSEPGLIGSGPYARLLETVFSRQRTIADSLVDKYQTIYQSGSAEKSTVVIGQGNPLDDIVESSSAYNLVAVGRSSAARKNDALDARIAALSHCPVVIVDKGFDDFSHLKLLISPYEEDLSYVRECFKFARAVGRELQVVALYKHSSDVDQLQLKKRLWSITAEDVEIKARVLENRDEPTAISFFGHCRCNIDITPSKSGSLIVLPTRHVNGSRVTPLGMTPAEFMRAYRGTAAMYWPENYISKQDESIDSQMKLPNLRVS